MPPIGTISLGRKCIFCNSTEDDPVKYGEVKEHQGITTHYFCLLLSSNMQQNGGDDEGILGFLPEDIHTEVRRGKRLACAFCKKIGATLGCVNKKCKRTFHLPCGLKNNSLHQFFGQFKSFCPTHRPKQAIDIKVRKQAPEKLMCYICYDSVHRDDLFNTLWAPCCKKNAWFHRDCVQQLALSAGYFFKCPLCNNKTEFHKAMKDCGIFIPSQDASWERVPHAFEELLYRHNRCDATNCQCPQGREHTSTNANWELVLCRTCGSQGIHKACGKLRWSLPTWDCTECSAILSKSVVNNTRPPRDNPPSTATVTRITADLDENSNDSDISLGRESPVNEVSQTPIVLKPGPRCAKLKELEKKVSAATLHPTSSSASLDDFKDLLDREQQKGNALLVQIPIATKKVEEKTTKIIPEVIIVDSEDELDVPTISNNNSASCSSQSNASTVITPMNIQITNVTSMIAENSKKCTMAGLKLNDTTVMTSETIEKSKRKANSTAIDDPKKYKVQPTTNILNGLQPHHAATRPSPQQPLYLADLELDDTTVLTREMIEKRKRKADSIPTLSILVTYINNIIDDPKKYKVDPSTRIFHWFRPYRAATRPSVLRGTQGSSQGINMANAAKVRFNGREFVVPLDPTAANISTTTNSMGTRNIHQAHSDGDAGTSPAADNIPQLANSTNANAANHHRRRCDDRGPGKSVSTSRKYNEYSIHGECCGNNRDRLMADKVLLRDLKFRICPDDTIEMTIRDNYKMNITTDMSRERKTVNNQQYQVDVNSQRSSRVRGSQNNKKYYNTRRSKSVTRNDMMNLDNSSLNAIDNHDSSLFLSSSKDTKNLHIKHGSRISLCKYECKNSAKENLVPDKHDEHTTVSVFGSLVNNNGRRSSGNNKRLRTDDDNNIEGNETINNESAGTSRDDLRVTLMCPSNNVKCHSSLNNNNNDLRTIKKIKTRRSSVSSYFDESLGCRVSIDLTRIQSLIDSSILIKKKDFIKIRSNDDLNLFSMMNDIACCSTLRRCKSEGSIPTSLVSKSFDHYIGEINFNDSQKYHHKRKKRKFIDKHERVR